MKRINPLSAAIGVSLLCAMAGTAMAGELRTADRPIEGRYIVVLKENAARLANERSSAARVSVAARAIASTHRSKLLRSYEHALRGFVVEADDAALARLLADPRVAYVEEDGLATINPTQSGARCASLSWSGSVQTRLSRSP